MSTDVYTLRLEKPVHGGHVLARLDGRVVFVRHGAPGELVKARITQKGKTWRADVVEVIEPHPQRVEVEWEHAGPGGVGAELAHLSLPAQRQWKHDVVIDALQHIGKLEAPVTIHAVDDSDGWGYRTRIDLTANDQGQAGMFAFRSHDHIALSSMPLAHPRLDELELFATTWPPGARISAIAPSADAPMVLLDGMSPPGHPGRVWERVGPHEYFVDAAGFWQAHYKAPEVLHAAVSQALGDISGWTVFDLYAGSGLLTLPLAQWVGPSGQVHAVEGHPRAHANAQENSAHLAQVSAHYGAVDDRLKSEDLPAHADAIVLDPPRVGARAEVMRGIIERRPQRIVYVSCDPAALARDLATAVQAGYRPESIEGYDLFPHTHHIESVVLLKPAD